MTMSSKSAQDTRSGARQPAGWKATLRNYKRLLQYALPHWRGLAVILGLTLVGSFLVALQPWPLKLLIDYALGGAPLPDAVQSVIVVLGLSPSSATMVLLAAFSSLAVFIVNSGLDIGLTLAWSYSGQAMVYTLTADLFEALQRRSLASHSRQPVGDSLSRLTVDVYCVYTVMESLLISPGKQLFTLLTIGFVAWSMNAELTLLTLMVAPLMSITALYFGQRLKERNRENLEAKSSLLSFVQQTLTAIPVVQVFGTEKRNRTQYNTLAADAVAISLRGKLLGSTHGFVNGLITTTGAAVVLFVAGQQVLSGALTVGSLVVFLAYLRSLHSATRDLFNIYSRLKSTEASIDRIFEILDSREVIRSSPYAKGLPLFERSNIGHVLLEGVTFGYDRDHVVLDNISLEVQPGETVALVGPTGSGKSTLVSLIPRFFDPWQGRVLVNGLDVRQAHLKSLRSQIAIVLQDPFLMPLTVAENIAYGRPNAPRTEIEAAAMAAGADTFVRRLPQGYDTLLGEWGATLSGGEKQRLAIARALLKDAAILILDEPTSALDAQTEASLQTTLEPIMKTRTTFIVAHRLSTVRRADRIIVIDGGRIVEIGTHAELLAISGAYQRLYSAQYSGVKQKVSV
jgi:ATP-binding cassette subfamily B protein